MEIDLDSKISLTEDYDSDETFLDNTAAFAKAARLNLEVFIPSPYQLTVDIDLPYVPSSFYLTLEKVKRYFNILGTVTTTSNNGNKHVHITLDDPLTDVEKIALQAILGSDPLRELFSLARCKKSMIFPILMFEKAEELAKIQ